MSFSEINFGYRLVRFSYVIMRVLFTNGKDFLMSIDARLKDLGIELPSPPPAVANYVPYVVINQMVIISGQLPIWEGQFPYLGKVGENINLEEAQKAARLCGINILTQLKMACEGDLNRVLRCVRLGGFVNGPDDFKDQPKIINGASDLMVEVFGDKGRHARAAVGVNSLPLGVPVEVEAMFLLK
ncbi:RidA family protein [Candidatus Bealeia paramacronuclearis]|uniref:RidA family protein n=1 Tax=Candidatus Bealeia paramacronuclearis TaxID=1921001 RepID=A0ABZ2C0U7_9PROT|nr:RidA family protein [Candidatus Bealeia paramacronuclearis]